MSVLVLKDVMVELSSRNDVFLKGITSLILEVSVNEQVVDNANLLSQAPNPWKWDADQTLILPEVATDFVISVVTEAGGNERQTIASIGLNGLELSNTTRNQYEIPLISSGSCPNLVLKMRTVTIENIQQVPKKIGPSGGHGGELEHRGSNVEEMCAEARIARRDFEQYGRLERLEQAISQYRTAIEYILEDDPKAPAILNNLAISLLQRFGQLGHLDDIDEAIERLQRAILLTPEEDFHKAGLLTNLGSAFIRRFERLGNHDDLKNAIEQQEAAVHMTPDGILDMSSRLNNLGMCLKIRFEQLGGLDDIESAIIHLQQAVDLALDIDPNKPDFIMNLGTFFFARFLLSGNIADIDGAIAQEQLAVNLTSNKHPSKPSRLSNLGSSLQVRFERLKNLDDLDNAIKIQQQAASLTPDTHPTKPALLNNLGTTLGIRFQRLRDSNDIDNAILQHQKAVDLMPTDHLDKPTWLTNLGTSLNVRFNHFGNIDDINHAALQLRIAADLTPDSHPEKSTRLGNFGASLRDRFRQLGNVTDLDEAIKNEKQALDLTPMTHADRARRLYNLALSFLDRFNRLHDQGDAEAAISHFSAAAMSPEGPPTVRFDATDAWIKLASTINHDSLLTAYECALELMPLVAWLGLPIADRHQHLVRMGGIAREAASAAISANQYDKALEWLEQGRSIVWTQILHLRTPVDQLREVNPDLANRLSQVSRLLDHGTQQNRFSDREDLSVEEEGRQYRALTAEWEDIIKQVRALPDFEDFLRPLSSSRLKHAAHNGPVVMFNISETRCDALALLPGHVVHIPLPNITPERITELREDLKNQLYSSGIRMRHTRAAKRVTEDADKDACRRVLAELWTNLAKPVLDSLALEPHPNVFPRIWWCTTGPLAFLPIHAAGIYGPDSNDSQLSNYVISSYIPTVSTLLDPVKPAAISPFNLLSVIQSSAPGASAIPSTKKELEYIRQHLTTRGHVVLEGPAGTKKRVMDEMKNCNWLHLACHGTQKSDEPTKSALLLDDGHLTLEEIIKLDLPHAEFAFLSACQTTTGDESLSEEAVHIAGGMLLAGYRSVVATMWSIQDDLAPTVTDEFYRHIMSEGASPDPRKAAEALHMSMEKLRQQPGVQLTDWIPFVHLGF
ncbi:hypothetical protein CPB86DRAFT_819449 [Serendipita vermifera]|nr:hypothetical protein CPB86DRAFT_819449 [Serendipita vermifera]